MSHQPCFRQVHCFVQGPLRFLHLPPNPTCARSHIWGFPIFSDPSVRGFEKGLADRGGWREEILPVPEIQASFCILLPIPPLGEDGHNSGQQFCCVWGPVSRPTPSRQPLFETSESSVMSWTSPRDVSATVLVFQDLEGLTRYPPKNFLFLADFCS